jgi:hypothetical protein
LRRTNNANIWLLVTGGLMGFAFSLITAYFLGELFLIADFVLLVIVGITSTILIGRTGGEFSEETGPFAIVFEGLVLGLTFDLLRLRFEWIINLFRGIALGSLFVVMAWSLRRSLAKYTENNPTDGPYLGFMRESFLFILGGFCFATSVNSLSQYFLSRNFFIATLIVLIASAIYVMFSASGDTDLFSSDSGVWHQLFVGASLGLIYELIFVRSFLWQDLLKMFVVFMVTTLTAFIVRGKSSTQLDSSGIQLELSSKKPKKQKKVIGDVSPKKSERSRKRKR